MLLVLNLSAADAVRAAEPFAVVSRDIRQKLQQHNVPSIVVAVARGNGILWEEGFGWADKEKRIAATPSTPYMLGSTSKPITATAILVLWQRGLLDLDRPLNDYLGGRKLRARLGDVSAATVRRVLQHTAGLPGYYETYYPDEPVRPPSLDTVIERYGVTMLPPGEKFAYTNLGYGLLGGTVEHVSGRSYADFLRQEVFGPLGMRHSFAPGSGSDPAPAGVISPAVRYLADGTHLPNYATPHAPASDVHASAHDLALFGLFHLRAHLPSQKPILSDRAIGQMQECTVPMGKQAYGLGWHIRRDAHGRRQVLHGGASAGVDVQFTLVPEEKLCVVVLSNATRHFPGAVAEYVTNGILAHVLGGKPDDFPILQPVAAPLATGLPGKLKGEWTGAVHTPERALPVTIWFRPEGKVEARLGDQPQATVRDARLDGAVFTGKMTGHIDTPDARRRRHDLEWEVTLRSELLSGIVYAVAGPGDRGLRLGYWVELHREGQ